MYKCPSSGGQAVAVPGCQQQAPPVTLLLPLPLHRKVREQCCGTEHAGRQPLPVCEIHPPSEVPKYPVVLRRPSVILPAWGATQSYATHPASL